jgi:SEC-C motif
MRRKINSLHSQLVVELTARADSLSGDEVSLVSCLVGNLAEMADPETRAVVDTAFAADAVDTSVIDLDTVEERYREGGFRREPDLEDWLENYRLEYQEQRDQYIEQIYTLQAEYTTATGPKEGIEALSTNDLQELYQTVEESIRLEREVAESRARLEAQRERKQHRPPPPIATQKPVRVEHKPGRNDPCWCGSGKKYKHCHLREDEQKSQA